VVPDTGRSSRSGLYNNAFQTLRCLCKILKYSQLSVCEKLSKYAKNLEFQKASQLNLFNNFRRLGNSRVLDLKPLGAYPCMSSILVTGTKAKMG